MPTRRIKSRHRARRLARDTILFLYFPPANLNKTMRRFVKTCQAVAATTKKSLKRALVSELFQDLSVEDAAQAAIFLTGRAFPNREERVLGVGGSQLAKLVAQMAGADTNALGKSYRVHGDLGDMAEHLLLNRSAAAAVPTDVTPGTDVSAANRALSFISSPTCVPPHKKCLR